MKTIIISDISSSTESIIPYGLRLAKAFESEVDILHVIDPRTHQGSYSPTSDSQSISPGNTLSHAETIRHEKHRISIQLDQLLSSEASRLNYPLKINRVIVQNILNEELDLRVKDTQNCVLVMNAEADQDMFDTSADIVRVIKKTGIPSFVVPPGLQFKTFLSALMPLDFDRNNISYMSDLKFLFDHFKLTIDAVGVATKGNYPEMELKGIAWRNNVANFFLPVTNLKTNILEGEEFINTVSNYFRRNPRDLLIIVNNNSKKSAVSDTIQLLNNAESPALVYFPN